jgi:LEA14-like dessication related protein
MFGFFAMKTPWLRFLAPAFVCFFLSGCLSSNKLGGVVVNITEIQPISASEFSAALQITNENVMAIGVTNYKYELFLNNKFVAESQSNEAFALPQLSRIKQTAVFKIVNPSFLHGLVKDASTKSASYRLDGKMRVLSGEEKLEIISRDSGTLDLRPLEDKF